MLPAHHQGSSYGHDLRVHLGAVGAGNDGTSQYGLRLGLEREISQISRLVTVS